MRGLLLLLAMLLVLHPALAQDERNTMTRLIEWATGGQVRLVGLEGWIPGAPRAARVEVHDAQGPWLVLEDVQADWSSLALLRGRAQVGSLSAARAVVSRRPVSDSAAAGGGDLPMQVSVEALRIGRLEVAPAVTGLDETLVLSVSGALDLAALDQGTVRLLAEGVDRPGRLQAEARLAPQALAVDVSLAEPAGGLVAGLAGLPDLGALSASLHLAGQRAAPEVRLDVRAGELTLAATGAFGAERLALDVTARAPAMVPGPGVSWRAVSVDAHVSGPPAAPEARGRIVVEAFAAGEARLARLAADLSGDAGRIRLTGRGEGLVLPAPLGTVLRDAPVVLELEAALAEEGRPVEVRITHPLLALAGTVRTSGVPEAQLVLDLPQLDPLAPEVSGSGQVRLTLRLPEDGADVAAEGWFRLGQAPVVALAGRETRFALAGTRRGERSVIDRLEIDTPAVRLSGTGSWDNRSVAADLDASVPDLALAAPMLRGAVRLGVRVEGRPEDFAVVLTGTGVAGTEGFAPLPVTLDGRVVGLPGAPEGRISASATLEGAKLELTAVGARAADGTLRLEVPVAQWKSARAQASLVLAPGASLPVGTARVEIGRLEELRPFVAGIPSGRVTAEAARDDGGALRARVEAVGVAPFETIALHAEGTPEAVALTLSARGHAAIEAAARLDVAAQVLVVSALRAAWQDKAAVLQAPARIELRDGVRLERVRLDVGGGVVEVAGRVAPTLDLSASLRGLPAAMALPGLDGIVQGEAKLAGTTAAPTGTLRLSAAGLRYRDDPIGLPAGTVTATATLAGNAARVDARVALGRAQATATGTVPLGSGSLDLRLGGQVPLEILDPLLTAQGRRARGDVVLDGRVGGTLAAPVPAGTLRLARGELRDDTVGLRLHDLAGTAGLEGDRVALDIAGKAGAGSVVLSGNATLAAAATLDLRLLARDARPVTSDLVTALLDTDLALRGQLGGDLLASGRIDLKRVEIRIPERMPARLPVLKVRRLGAPPAPPPAPLPAVALDVVVQAPGNVFVRGRGLEAELAGRVAFRGSLAAPRPDGALALRRGSFNLLGRALTLTEGQVTMDGTAVLDPAIDFAATTRTTATSATVRVTGRASAPEIRLTSQPELPQDEILAQLLLGRSVNQLNALQLAQIAAGLAELSGKGSGLDPLGRLRGGLGLDRLSLGSTESGATTLEAGRNLAPGVYLGVRQGTGDAGTQATVQVDIGRGLKLQGEVGTSTGAPSATGSSGSGNSVGLLWSREW